MPKYIWTQGCGVTSLVHVVEGDHEDAGRGAPRYTARCGERFIPRPDDVTPGPDIYTAALAPEQLIRCMTCHEPQCNS